MPKKWSKPSSSGPGLSFAVPIGCLLAEAEVPLADAGRGVAALLEHACDRRLPRVDRQGRAQRHGPPKVATKRVATAEQAIARRRAHGGGAVGIDKATPFTREAIDVGRVDVRRAVTSEIAKAEVVGVDQDDVRRPRLAVSDSGASGEAEQARKEAVAEEPRHFLGTRISSSPLMRASLSSASFTIGKLCLGSAPARRIAQQGVVVEEALAVHCRVAFRPDVVVDVAGDGSVGVPLGHDGIEDEAPFFVSACKAPKPRIAGALAGVHPRAVLTAGVRLHEVESALREAPRLTSCRRHGRGVESGDPSRSLRRGSLGAAFVCFLPRATSLGRRSGSSRRAHRFLSLRKRAGGKPFAQAEASSATASSKRPNLTLLIAFAYSA